MGYYYNYKKDLVKTYKAGINLLLHYEKIGYDSGLLKEPQYKYEILYDEDIDKALLKIVNNKTYENWVSSIINDFLNARVDYLKEHNLFNN